MADPKVGPFKELVDAPAAPAEAETPAAQSPKPKSKKNDDSAGLIRREADEALRLAVAATRAADQALQRALLANRGNTKIHPADAKLININTDASMSRSSSVDKNMNAEKHEDELQFTGVPFGGMWQDIKRRGKVYGSDWIDGIVNPGKTLSATCLLYFACLAPAIAFGALLEKFTHGDMGAIECIVSTFVCGTINAMLAGQPLLILGGTGPVAIFESIVYKVSTEIIGVPFLIVRYWTGMWIAVILAIIAIFDLCFFIKYITRFTDEIFAGLISTIFIYEALKGLMYPLGKSYDQAGQDTIKDAEHDSGTLLSILLGLGTFLCLLLLRNFRKSKFLLPQVRTLLADFSPIFAIGFMTFIDYQLNDVTTAKLRIPDTFVPSKDCRSWFITPMSYGPEMQLMPSKETPDIVPLYNFAPLNCSWSYKTDPDKWLPISEGPQTAIPSFLPFITIAPALLASVLLYLDQNITARLMNKADNRLKKGAGYHLDMFVLSIVIFTSSSLGLPWMCAATVRSINHLLALSDKETVISPDGHRSDVVVKVTETRCTGLLIHCLIGASLLIVGALKFVPMAVLLGLFLTMGITSLQSIQLWERICLLLMEPKLYPSTSFVRQVPMAKLHAFTIIQILGLVLLMVVKKSPFAVCFPLVILLFVPIRSYLLPHIFTPRELRYLDSEEEIDDEGAIDEIVDL
uniref:Bicarbonate transporter-like transmembrane domain-containing protein n=1 Tax=Coccolithus braarudii TaxID=221442 RepID=A0A7S0PZ07_9EUKA|mmetsp:Transcript_16268/g.35277  ORF Transcript_16268/g.35277 Transcript_16268/m.35277 type:complete len:689 (+) Transcript_16268:2-2068(+)